MAQQQSRHQIGELVTSKSSRIRADDSALGSAKCLRQSACRATQAKRQMSYEFQSRESDHRPRGPRPSIDLTHCNYLDAVDDHLVAGGIGSRNQRLLRYLDSTCVHYEDAQLGFFARHSSFTRIRLLSNVQKKSASASSQLRNRRCVSGGPTRASVGINATSRIARICNQHGKHSIFSWLSVDSCSRTPLARPRRISDFDPPFS